LSLKSYACFIVVKKLSISAALWFCKKGVFPLGRKMQGISDGLERATLLPETEGSQNILSNVYLKQKFRR
jgi:hypothetical protein